MTGRIVSVFSSGYQDVFAYRAELIVIHAACLVVGPGHTGPSHL